jgi:protein ImuB
MLTAAPHRIAVDGQPPRAVLGWAGPWPVEERWWEPGSDRRRARLQVVLDGPDSTDGPDGPASTQDGVLDVLDGPDGRTALLLACENGYWRVEGVYD